MTLQELKAKHDLLSVEEAIEDLIKFYEEDKPSTEADPTVAALDEVRMLLVSLALDEAEGETNA